MPESLRVGITCFPTFGGSSVIAVEVGLAMAARGHEVHFISNAMPGRLPDFRERVYFHEVTTPQYPLFENAPYTLALSSRIIQVCEQSSLDLLHVHYAIPHATSAYLARQVLGSEAPKIVTTLHGTDITLVGKECSYLPITRFSVQQSDGVTVPSEFLRGATRRELGLGDEFSIALIPNFVDTDLFAPGARADHASLQALFGDAVDLHAVRMLTHVSNFRPIKRPQDVVRIFHAVNERVPSVLLLLGDGPERSGVEALARELGIAPRVRCLGKQAIFAAVLKQSDVFLLPSEQESFGLAALEALSCGVPVVASRVGGLGEVVEHGRTGYLEDVGDVAAMADRVVALLTNETARLQMGRAAREDVMRRFQRGPMIDRYEAYYRTVLEK